MVQSTVTAKTTLTSTSPTTIGPLTLILNLEVAAAAVDRPTPKQYPAGNPAPQPQQAPQALFLARPPSAVLTYSYPSENLSLTAMTQSGASTLLIQQSNTIFWRRKTIPVTVASISKKENVLERSIAAENQGPAKGPLGIEGWILFPRR